MARREGPLKIEYIAFFDNDLLQNIFKMRLAGMSFQLSGMSSPGIKVISEEEVIGVC